jgi:threonine/homoserine/homoserine lactone efflux protein
VDGVVAVLLLGFFGVAALVIVTPGQDTALTIRNTLRGGRRGGVLTAFGVSTAQCCWALATSAGLAALLVASEPVFMALRLVGAAYLIFLGVQSLVRAVRGGEGGEEEPGGRGRARRRPFRQGLVSNLGNPKMAVFFTSLLPQFAHSFAGLLVLGLVFAAMTATWLSAYAFAVAKAGDVLRRSAVRRVIDAVVGAVLVAFGSRLATER